MKLARSNIIALCVAVTIGSAVGGGVRRLPLAGTRAVATTPPPAGKVAVAPRPPVAASVAPVSVAPVDTTPARIPSPPAAAVIDSATAGRRDRLAKMFAGMEPKDAAHVLEQMADDDIVAVLTTLRERQAAAILSQLQPKRAAAVTRSLLAGVGARS